jgi:hypothetical protein
MLARSTKISHPLGITIETPLLIPSFSSKGFGVSKRGKSEIREIFTVASPLLTDTMLVSAYDLSQKHLDPIVSAITEIIFVDSGGYEISDIHDLSAVYRYPVIHESWTDKELREVYDHWPEHVPAVFVSYDHPDERRSLADQITDTRKLFKNYPHQLHTLLIKPETEGQKYIQTKNILANVKKLGAFQIIGFTEKELGKSILEKMTRIATIRLAMDNVGLQRIPIHIFGSLDPLVSVLYFLAGAEIFDGLTWIRYAYTEGQTCYLHNYGVRYVGINKTEDAVKVQVMRDNLNYLLRLTHQMRTFLHDGDFSNFGHDSRMLRESYGLLRKKNKRF